MLEAVINGHVEAVQLLLTHGAHVEEWNFAVRPLQEAETIAHACTHT